MFPVTGKGFDDIISTFGPRGEFTYDFSRGINIAGNVGDDIVAAHSGIFWDYVEFAGSGPTLILQHELPSAVVYGGQALTYFYTFYMGVFDDGIPGNATSTDDIISAWTPGVTAVTAGQLIGEVGAEFATPQLHFQLRDHRLRFRSAPPSDVALCTVSRWAALPADAQRDLLSESRRGCSPSLE